PAGLLAPRGLVVGSAATRAAHHTAEYASGPLVARRGQPFDLRVLLPRPFDPEEDGLCVELTLVEEEEAEGAEPPGGPALRLAVTAPPHAPIGRYRLSVKTRTGAGEYAAPFDAANDVFLLFNPWCP
uniref:Transglutaminase N-terminal domain-containing protein n=1 Tax=Falco tinnunculus TaxID=100819 RepID=A0A8C4UKT0_FALTI